MIRRVEDFVVEDGEVQREPETNGVRGCKVGLCDLGGSLVRNKGLVCGGLALVAKSEFSKVTVVITFPKRGVRILPD